MDKQTYAEYEIIRCDYSEAVKLLDNLSDGTTFDEALKRVDEARERLNAVRLKIQLETLKELAELEELVCR
jgi:hypothetical protein